jgi:hypothetical protein
MTLNYLSVHHLMNYYEYYTYFALTTSVVIGTDCIGSCRSNYHTITATTVPDIEVNEHERLSKLKQRSNSNFDFQQDIHEANCGVH